MYPKRLPFYENEEGMGLLHRLALRRGVKAAALLRMLVREEAERVGLSASPPASEEQVTGRPIWEEIDVAMRALPEAVLDTLPTDLAEQHDHYLYAAPKR